MFGFVSQLENIKAYQCDLDEDRTMITGRTEVKIPELHKRQLQYAIQLHLNSRGQVKLINARKEESRWSMNFKRGVATMFQISPKRWAAQNKFEQQYEV